MTAGILVGCSEQPAGSSTSRRKSVDEIVLSLTRGTSPEDAKASLGEPASEGAYGREVVLTYPPWQLYFQEGKLRQRVREARSGRTSPIGRVLNRKVLWRLVPGMTVRAVRQVLGTPEVYEQIYEFDGRRALILRYAYWELYFRKGRLVRRTQN